MTNKKEISKSKIEAWETLDMYAPTDKELLEIMTPDELKEMKEYFKSKKGKE